MAGTFPESWEEVCIISIMKKGEGVQQFAGITETVDISEPDYPGESIATCAGGRIWKQMAQEDGEITLELYPISADYMKGGLITTSIDGDANETTMVTAAVHGLSVGDGVAVSDTANYGTTASPTFYTVRSVTNTTTVVMKPGVNQAAENDGTWIGYLSNKGLFQQYMGSKKTTTITGISEVTDTITITAAGHGLAVGDIVDITGTTNTNGRHVVNAVAGNDFDIISAEAGDTGSVGKVTKIADASQPISTDTSYPTSGVMFPQDDYMVAILWTTDTAAVSATDVTAGANFTGLRFYAKNCKITSHKSSFTDGILKITATFKFAPMNKAGTTKNFAWESTDDTDTNVLPALTYS